MQGSHEEKLVIDEVEYVRAYPVADGRCPHCGGITRRWTPARILERLRAWREQFGVTPSANKLMIPPADYPSTRVVVDYFGSWDAALQAADLPANSSSNGIIWSRERIVEAMVAWARVHGDAPKAIDWLSSAYDHPAARTVLTRFGTWNAAIDTAGFFPRGPYGRRLRSLGEKDVGGRTLVNAAPVADAIREYLGVDGTTAALAELMNVDATPIRRILNGTRERIEHRAADEILTAIDRPDVLAILEPVAA